jgi:hypothetical protein
MNDERGVHPMTRRARRARRWTRLTIAATPFLLLASSCSQHPALSTNPLASFSRSEEKAVLSGLAADADYVFVGRVAELGQPPATWSGYYLTTQKVRYVVEDVLKGDLSSGEPLAVAHVVVAGSRQANPQAVGLDPDLFVPDRRFIVFAKRLWDEVVVENENYGILPFTMDEMRAVRRLVEARTSPTLALH